MDSNPPEPEPTELDRAIEFQRLHMDGARTASGKAERQKLVGWLEELREAKVALEIARMCLRVESDAGYFTDDSDPYSCTHCGFVGPFAVHGCMCEPENARWCTTANRGPQCPHGKVYCPVCGGEDADPVHEGSVAQALMVIERQLGVVYTEEELDAAPDTPPNPDPDPDDTPIVHGSLYED